MSNLKPKIALLTNYPADHERFSGGVETASAGLLDEFGHYSGEMDFVVVALARGIPQEKVEIRDGILYHFIPVPDGWYTRPRFVANLVRARRCLNTIRPDLLHCQDNMTLALAALLCTQCRRLFTVHGIKQVEASVWEGPEYWSHRFDAILERIVRKRFPNVIAVSEYVDQFLPEGAHVFHVPNPVPRWFFTAEEGDRKRDTVLFIGSLTRLKRPLDLLKAFRLLVIHHPGSRLVVVGLPEDQEYTKELVSFVRDHELKNVEFRKSCDRMEIVHLMSEATVLAVTSVHENSPMVIAEAMAAGLPVVASAVGGIPYMIEDGVTGLLYRCGDSDVLAEQLRRLIGDRDLRSRISRAAKQAALSRYSSQVVARSTIEIYRTLLREG
jgi:glycosyltransferase involved in cell wall biosynthesis